MQTKIKRIVYGLVSATLFAPVLAAAQFKQPGDTNLPQGTVFNIINNIMKWLLGLVGVIGVIGFAIAGIMYLVSAGDDEGVKRAKKAMIMSLVGVIVALVGLVILQAANKMLGGTDSIF